MKALLSTMISPTSLFLARRFQDMGIAVTGADPDPRAYGFYSRAVQKRIVVPSLREEPREFAGAIREEIKQGDYDIYVPTMECAYLMSAYREEINRQTRMISPSFSDIMFLHNKANLQEVSRLTSVPCPEKTFAPESMVQARRICGELDVPVIIKHRTGRNGNGQELVKDPGTIWPIYQQVVKKYKLENRLPLIQQFIQGDLISTVNLALDGEVLGHVAFKSLRMTPPSGGTSSYRMTENCSEAEKMDRRIIGHFGWTGFLSMDYLREQETRRLFLIDVNPRPAPGIILGHQAGVDLAGAYLDLLLEREIRPLNRQQEGIRGKIQFLDLGWVLFALTEKGKSPGERWNDLRQWLRREKFYYDILDFRDIKPILMLYYNIFRNFRRIWGPDAGEIFLEHVLYDEDVFYPRPEERAGAK